MHPKTKEMIGKARPILDKHRDLASTLAEGMLHQFESSLPKGEGELFDFMLVLGVVFMSSAASGMAGAGEDGGDETLESNIMEANGLLLAGMALEFVEKSREMLNSPEKRAELKASVQEELRRN